MSTTIDNRVVEMKFDNQQFEKNVKTSINSLNELNESLRLEDASKGFEEVEKAAKKVDFQPIASAIQTVKIKFSALEYMATRVLKDIADEAMRRGKKIGAALTIDPIKTGFQEYETQINATQTILSNTQKEGATINDVNAALDELNKYADLTIYNFTEMTRNIGTFTAAGVDLKTSVSAIQGIANLAAVSGSTSQQASTAMYQLSQALASGTVKLMDWNSVVNAGMGGQVFQDALKDTARQHGIAIDAMIKKQGSFRETLQKGWLTSEILTETLSKFTTSGVNEYLAKNSDLTIKSIENMRREAVATGDSTNAFKSMAKTIAETSKLSETEIYELLKMSQTAEDAATKVKTFTQLWDVLKEAAQSGWSATWRTVVGDYEEAKELLTEFSDSLTAIISESADKRNKKLVEGLSNGWKQLLNEGITNSADFEEVVKETAKEYGIAIDDLIDTSGSFEKSLKDGWINSDILATSIEKVTKKTSDLSDAELENLGYTREQAEAIAELNERIQNGTLNLDEFVKKMSKSSGRENLIESIKNVFQYIMSIVKPVRDAFEEVFGTTGKQIYDLTAKIKNFTSKLKLSEESAAKIKSTFKGLFAIVDIGKRAILAILKALKPLVGLFGNVGDGLLDVTSGFGDFVIALDESIKKSDIFTKIINGISTAISNVVTFIKPFITVVNKFVSYVISNFGKAVITVREWFNTFLQNPKVSLAVESIRSKFSGMFGWLSKKFSEAKLAFSGFVDRIRKMDGLSLSNIGKVISDFWNNVVKPFFDFNKIFENAGKSLNDFKEKVFSFFGTIGDIAVQTKNKLINVISWVFNFVKDNWSWVMSLASGLALFKFIKNLSKLIRTLDSLLMPIKNIGKSVVDVLTSVKSAIDTWKKNQRAKNILYLAGAIGILALSLALLTQLPLDKLAVAAGLMVALGGALTGFSIALSKFGQGGVSVWAVIGFAAALLVLVNALRKIDEIADFYTSWTKLGALALMLTTFVGALSLIAPKLSKNAFAMLIFAISLNSLVNVIKKIDKFDTSGINFSLDKIAGIFLSLIVLAGTIRLAGKYMVRAGVGLIAISYALKSVANSIKELAALSPETFVQGMEAIKNILLLFGLILGAASLVGGANIGKAGTAFIAMSGAIVLLILAIKMIGNTDRAIIEKGKKVVYEMLAVFAGIVVLSQYAGQHALKAGVMILTMAAAITLLIIPITLLSLLDPSGLKRAMSAITQMSLCFALMIKSTNLAAGAKGKNCAKELIIMTTAIALMAIAIGALSAINGEALKSAANALSQVMAVFALMTTATYFAKESMSSLISLTLATGVLGLVLAMLGKLKAENVIASANALSEVMIALTLAFVVLSNTKAIGPKTMTSLGYLTLITAGLGAIIGVLSYLNVGSTLEIAESLSLLLLAFSASCYILARVGALGPAVESGILVLGELVAGAGIVVAAFAGLAMMFPKLTEYLDDGIEIIRKIGEGLGSLIGGFLAGVLSGLPQNGKYLSDFMTEVNGFVEGIKNVGSENLEGARALAETVLVLTESSILDAITSWLPKGNSMTNFAANLVLFGNAMHDFAESTSDINPEKLQPAAESAKLLAEMASTLPKHGGLLQGIIGDTDMAEFAGQLILFGSALQDFSNSVSGIDEKAVEAGASAGKLLAEMAAALPNSGGLVAMFVGENDMDDFAGRLTLFGGALESFSRSCENINADNVKSGAESGKLVAEMASTIGNSGGLIAKLFGENDMGEFAGRLILFAGAMEKFSEASGNIKIQNVITGTTSGLMVTEMANAVASIKKSDDVSGLYEFAGDLALFALALADFSDASANIDDANVEKGISASGKLQTIIPSIRDLLTALQGSGFSLFGGFNEGFKPENLKAFNEGITLLGEALKSFSESCSEIKLLAYANGVIAAQKLVEINNSLFGTGGVLQRLAGEKDLTRFSKGVTNLGSSLRDFCISVGDENVDPNIAQKAIDTIEKIKEINNSLDSSGGVWQWLAGEKDLSGFSTGITNLGSSLRDFCISVSTPAVDLDTTEAGITIAEKLVEAYKGLQPGASKDYTGFSTGVTSLGGGISAFAKSIEDVTVETINKGVKAVESFTKLYGILDKNGGLFSIFTGTKDLDDFSNKLGTLGKGISDFGEEVVDIDPLKTMAAAMACISIGEALQSIGKYTALPSSIKMLLKTLGESLKKYYSDISEIDTNTVAKVTAAVDSLIMTVTKLTDDFNTRIKNFSDGLSALATVGIDAFLDAVLSAKTRSSEIAAEMVSNFTTGATKQSSNFRAAFTYVVNNGLTAILSKVTEFKMAGQNTVNSFVAGFVSGTGTIKSTLNTTLDKIKAELKSKISDFTNIGKYYVQGLANGLENSKYIVTVKARAVAKALDDSVRNYLGIHSPSKKGEEIGRFIDEGIGKGLSKYTSAVQKGIDDVVKTITNSNISEIADKFAEKINDSWSGVSQASNKGSEEATKNVTRSIGAHYASITKTSVYNAGKFIENSDLVTNISNALSSVTKDAKEEYNDLWSGVSQIGKKGIGDLGKTITNSDLIKNISNTLSGGTNAAKEEIDNLWSGVSQTNKKESEEAAKKVFNPTGAYYVALDKALPKINPFGKLEEEMELSEFYKRQEKLKEEYAKSWVEIDAIDTKATSTIEKNEEKSAKRRNSKSKKSGKERLEQQEQINEESIELERSYWHRMLELQKEAEAATADESTSIFSELSSDTDSTAKKKQKDLAKILKERMAQTEKYLKLRNKLEARLKGSKLWNYVSTLGEDSLSDLEALNSMTEDKLKEYADLYEKYFALGIEKAKKVLSESDLQQYQEKILETTTSTLKTYQDEIDKITGEYLNSSGIFDSSEIKEAIAPQTLMNNLNAQITRFEYFMKVRDSLKNKLENNETTLWEDVVKDLGVDKIAELEALDRLSNADLNTYSWLYEKKKLLAKSLAEESTKTLKEETEKSLSELYGVDVNLDEFLSSYDGTFESIDSYVVEKAKQTGSSFVSGFGTGVTKNADAAIDAGKEVTNEAIVESKALAATESRSIGKNFVMGFANGITGNAYLVSNAAYSVGSTAASAANSALGIASPSKVMFESGRYTVIGFVNGLKDLASSVYSTGSDIGDQAKNGLLSSVSKIASLMDGSIDYQPTIRPVLDLSNVEAGSRRLSSLLSSDQAMRINTSMNKAAETKIQNRDSNTVSGPVYQFTQNNYSPKALSRIDIYRQTKNQFSALKGLVRT